MADCYHASRRRYYENVTQGIQGLRRKGERGRYGGRRHCRRRVREDRHIARQRRHHAARRRADRRDRLQQSFSPARREYLRHARRSGGRGRGGAQVRLVPLAGARFSDRFVRDLYFCKEDHGARKKEAPVEEAPKTKVCPYCKSEIAIDATRCPHCTSELP